MKSHELLPLLPFVAPETLARTNLPDRALLNAEAGPRTFLLRGGELTQLKQQIARGDPLLTEGLTKLRALADEVCRAPALTVTDKQKAPKGATLNDYASHAIYFWPNPETETGLPYVRRDGEVNPEASDEKRFDVRRLEQFSENVFVLSLAYFLSGEAKYGKRAAELLRTWFITPKTRQTPHFEFAQGVTGKMRGRPEGLIEARRLLYVLDAEALIKDCPAWTAADAAALREWVASFFDWFRTSKIGLGAAAKKNNIGLWYDAQAAIYALYLDETALAETIVRGSVKERLATQVGPDGAPLQELDRARPYDYAAFNLLAMMGLARAGEAVGFDAWWADTKDGRSFQRALEWTLRVAGSDQAPQAMDLTLQVARLEAERTRVAAQLKDASATAKTQTSALEHARVRAVAAEARAAELGEANQQMFERVADAERRADKSAETARKAEREQAKRVKMAEEEKERADRLLGALEAAQRELEARAADLREAKEFAQSAAQALRAHEQNAALRAAEQDARLGQAVKEGHAAELRATGLAQDLLAEKRRVEEISATSIERVALQDALIAETRERLRDAEARTIAASAALVAIKVENERELAEARADAARHALERDAALAAAQEAAIASQVRASQHFDEIAAERARAAEAERALGVLQSEFAAHAAQQAADLAFARESGAAERARAAEAERALGALQSEFAAHAAQQAADLATVQERGAALVADREAELAAARDEARQAASKAELLETRLAEQNERLTEALDRADAARSEAAELARALTAERERVQESSARADQSASQALRLIEELESERARAEELALDLASTRNAVDQQHDLAQGAEARLALALRQAETEAARGQAFEKEAEKTTAELRQALSRILQIQGELAAEAEKGANDRQALAGALEEVRRRAKEGIHLREERDALRIKLAKSREAIAAANHSIETLRSSTSWRVTEPLRGAVRLLRGERPVEASPSLGVQARADPPSVVQSAPSAPAPPAAPVPIGMNGKAPAAMVLDARATLPKAPPPKKAPPTARATDRDAGCLPHYVAALRKSVGALEKTALRNRSLPARDLLARVATGGAFGYDQIEAVLETSDGPAKKILEVGVEALNKRAFAALARVVGNQAVTPIDYIHAISLYQTYIKIFGRGELRPIDSVLLVDLLVQQGRRAEAREALDKSNLAVAEPTEHACLLANILHPGAARAEDAQEWLAVINRLFSPHGVAPVRLTDAAGPLMTRLACEAPAHGDDSAPLISILMTTFNPDPTLAMAINSVLAQTWRRFELIIADDCSDEPLFAEVKALEKRDPRIRVLRMDKNGGTYAAKNRALQLARGEFVTCHDSDDWSHPQKLELQVVGLIKNVNIVGNLSSWLRATPEMQMQRFAGTGRMLYYNTSSMMFRREPVLARCGFYDSVRTGADSELYRRIEIAFEQTLPVIAEPPLSFGQVRAGALTHLSLGNGWESPDRKVYRAAWTQWHRELKSNGRDLRVDVDGARARFHAPLAVLPERTEAAERTFDVIIASDFRLAGGNVSACVEEIKANAAAGLRTAICQMNCYLPQVISKDNLDDRILDLLRDGIIEQVELDEDARCALLLLRYPPVLQFIGGLRSGIRPAQVRIIANQPPAQRNGSDRRYDVGACGRNAVALFGRQPIWAPTNALARASIEPSLSRTQIAASDWRNVINVEEWTDQRTGFVSTKPVIGRHAPDDASKWPEKAEILRAVYPIDGSVSVRILGGAAAALRVLGPDAQPGWEVLEFDAMAPQAFLSGLDFFVYFHHGKHIEASGCAILEALAAGCVVILPPHFEPLYGAAALYCDAAGVQPLVQALYADKTRYLDQSKRGTAYVREHFGYATHIARLNEVLPPRLDQAARN